MLEREREPSLPERDRLLDSTLTLPDESERVERLAHRQPLPRRLRDRQSCVRRLKGLVQGTPEGKGEGEGRERRGLLRASIRQSGDRSAVELDRLFEAILVVQARRQRRHRPRARLRLSERLEQRDGLLQAFTCGGI